jgi:hypothetical protein
LPEESEMRLAPGPQPSLLLAPKLCSIRSVWAAEGVALPKTVSTKIAARLNAREELLIRMDNSFCVKGAASAHNERASSMGQGGFHTCRAGASR